MAIVAIIFTFGVLGVASCFVRKRKWVPKRTLETRDHEEKSNDVQIYLQPKAEMEDEERRRHELEAREQRCEMGSAGSGIELPGNDAAHEISS